MAWIYNKYTDKDLPPVKRNLKRVGDWAISAAIIGWVGLSVVSCGSAIYPQADQGVTPATKGVSHGQGLYETTVTLKDGREVECLVYAYGSAGGLDCDWEGAK